MSLPGCREGLFNYVGGGGGARHGYNSSPYKGASHLLRLHLLHPGDVCSKVTGQRPPLLPHVPRIHPRGAAETLETAPVTDASWPTCIGHVFTTCSEAKQQQEPEFCCRSPCSRLDITLCRVSIFILRSVPPPHSWSPHQKKGQTGITHQENGVPSSLTPVVG